jgi:hypothetical protein
MHARHAHLQNYTIDTDAAVEHRDDKSGWKNCMLARVFESRWLSTMVHVEFLRSSYVDLRLLSDLSHNCMYIVRVFIHTPERRHLPCDCSLLT